MSTCMHYGKLLMAAAAALAASAVMAQGPGGGGGGGGGGFGGMGMGGGGGDGSALLLMAEPVQTELALSDDQKSDLQKFQQDMMANMRDMRQQMQGLSPEERMQKMQERTKENRKKIAAILLPPQMDRLDEIAIQQAGAMALMRDDVADKLGLSSDQKEKLKDVATDMGQKMRDIFSGGFPQDDQARQDMQKKMTDLRTQQSDKAMAVLTDEQKTKFEQMKGKKFDLTSIQMGFGRGGFGRGPGGGGPGGAPGGGGQGGGGQGGN